MTRDDSKPTSLAAAVLSVVAGAGEVTDETPVAWRCPRCGELVRLDPGGAAAFRALNASLVRSGRTPLDAIPCRECNANIVAESEERRRRKEAAERVSKPPGARSPLPGAAIVKRSDL